MNRELKSLAMLLVYPRKQLLTDLGPINKDIGESKILNENIKYLLRSFTKILESAPLSSVQKVYLSSFGGGAGCLNLRNHTALKQSADCREAEKRLSSLYHARGVNYSDADLPDSLPAILDFLSTLSYREARLWLRDAAPILKEIYESLYKVSSPWLAVISALVSLSEEPEGTEADPNIAHSTKRPA